MDSGPSDTEKPPSRCPKCGTPGVPYGASTIPGARDRCNLRLRCPQCGDTWKVEVKKEDLPFPELR